MNVKRIALALLGISIALQLGGCRTSSDAFDGNGASMDRRDQSERVVIVDDTLVYEDGETRRTLFRSDTAIEALAGLRPWLVWSEDNRKGIKLGYLQQDGQSMEITALTSFEHDAELLCLAAREPGIYDLFVHDGDAYFYQYWLLAEEKELRSVRRIPTNPEIDACVVTADALVFHDPYIGALMLDRDPETESILRRAQGPQVDALAELRRNRVNLEQPHAVVTPSVATITPVLETRPVVDAGDAADDPVVLVAGARTWIVGTNKQRGLAVYDLTGKQRHFSPRGRVNNVDAVALGDGEFLLAASNRTDKTIDLFRAHPADDRFTFVAVIALNMADPYGLCMTQSTGEVSVFVNDSDGVLEQWQLNAALDSGERVARYRFDSQTEGCVVDGRNRQLYIGEEAVGIWRLDIVTGERQLVASIADGALVADVEGLDIYDGDSARYLVASSQGDNSYVVYRMAPWQQLGKFRIVADIRAGIDGASETDGIALSARASDGFPDGMLVVQDGRNRAPEQPQNFKVVDWREIEALIQQWQ